MSTFTHYLYHWGKKNRKQERKEKKKKKKEEKGYEIMVKSKGCALNGNPIIAKQ